MQTFKGYLKKRRADTNKGDYGHVFILAGSIGFTGAAYLCSQAAILSGSGLVTLGIPSSLNCILACKLTEIMTKPLAETKELSLDLAAEQDILKFCEKVDVAAIGPGISRNSSTQALVRNLLKKIDKPVILDADGVNAIIGDLEILKKVKGPCIITPHPGEFSRLIGIPVNKIQKDRKRFAKNFASKYNVTLILKGYKTIVASARYKEIYINTTGNPGMATAGCGDVLTGMIASFIGQGLEPFAAAKLAVYLHGMAGDLAAKEKGQISLIATDLLNKLPVAIKLIHK